MVAWEDDELDEEVRDLARRVARWQRRRVGRARMPEPLWEAVLDVACEWGPYRAARVLGLSYSTVKRRLDARAAVPEVEEAEGPAFVEVLSPLMASQGLTCVLELEGASGARVRVEVKDISTRELLSLLQGLAA